MSTPNTPVILRRRPLQQITNIPIHSNAKHKPKLSEKEIGSGPTKEIEFPEASLAEELIAMRKMRERMRFERENTEKMLKEREVVIECWMNEVEERGQIQKMLENEVDRLFRLKELKFMKFSPIRSLREKEGGKKIRGARFQIEKMENLEESIGDCVMQSPFSASSEVRTED